jgi:NodT family efflux transporter outer membrane factor (OMF) lipoprotein
LALAAFCVAACRVGPDYHEPKSDVPTRFTEETQRPAEGEQIGRDWWRVLHDPVLDQLIADGLRDSPDLTAARARILEARAERAAVAGERLPELSAQAAYARQHGSANVPIGTAPGGLGLDATSNLWLAGFDASWELDIFGGTRRAIESADAALAASIADRDDAELMLGAEIVRNYIELRAEQRRLAIARQIENLRRDELALVDAQFRSGLATSIDAARARTELADSEAEVPHLEAAEYAALYRLGVLIGQAPESLTATLSPPGAIPAVESDVPVGLPSDLLRRRPDLRAAERRIAAANARIGMRDADLYPHFSLTGVAGFESLYANNFLSGPSRYYAVGPSITWLVFDAGRIHDEALAERARTDVAAAAYRKVTLGALAEVETALVAYGRSRIERAALEREVASATEADALARRLYASGLENFLTVLDAERTLHTSEMALAEAEQETGDAYVALVKALGGGWTNPTTSPVEP